MIILPPDYPVINGNLVFLAGPIQGAADWQNLAIDYFQQHKPSLHIANPRRNYLENTFNYATQVDWESHHLRRAAEQGVLLFFLAKEQTVTQGRAYAQTTRFELAEWVTRQLYQPCSIVIGIEEGFSGARYIRHRLGQQNPDIIIVDSLVAACEAVLVLTKDDKAL